MVVRSRHVRDSLEEGASASNRQFRVSVAAFALRGLEQDGAALGDVLNGEAGRRWVEESCGGDREVAAEAFELVHPRARVLRFPG